MMSTKEIVSPYRLIPKIKVCSMTERIRRYAVPSPPIHSIKFAPGAEKLSKLRGTRRSRDI